MIAQLAKAALVSFIKRRIKKAMFKKLLREGAGGALVIGAISAVLGVDIAPEDVDKVVTAAAVIAFYAPQIIDALKARFGKGKE